MIAAGTWRLRAFLPSFSNGSPANAFKVMVLVKKEMIPSSYRHADGKLTDFWFTPQHLILHVSFADEVVPHTRYPYFKNKIMITIVDFSQYSALQCKSQWIADSKYRCDGIDCDDCALMRCMPPCSISDSLIWIHCQKSVCKCVHLLANEQVSEYFELDNSRSYIVMQIDTFNFVSDCPNVWLILYAGVEYISTKRATTGILEASLFSPFKVLLVWLDESEWFVTDISVVSGSHKIMINPPVQLHSKNEPI